MRFLLAALGAASGAIAAAMPGAAQQASDRLAAEQRDIGRLEVHLQKYDQALGIVTRLRRPLGDESECNGICFFPSSSRGVAWRCPPEAACELHCSVNPPVGGCR
jgi:hypothetical protein